jgi:hypothetical protein
MPFAGAPEDSEEGRAFLQERLALFGKAVFFLFLAIAAAGLLAIYVTSPGSFSRMRAPPFHIVAILGVGVAWIICRRGRRSAGTLVVLDALILCSCGAGIALTLPLGAPELLPGVPVTLGVFFLLTARAIVVPSPWQRTAWVSGLAVLPALGFMLAFGVDGPGEQPGVAVATMTTMLTIWLVVSVATATWTSSVIYRLRRRIVEARRLGPYTLEERIGEGGMGVVYRARHAMLRRPTVVKLLPPEKAGDSNIARFEREVQHTSLLSSPNTVAVFDYGRTPDGTFYYAMEHLDGIDLDRLVAEAGPQPAARVVHVLAQVCTALAEAHEAGLVHRDIKPSNIMLCRHGGALDVARCSTSAW